MLSGLKKWLARKVAIRQLEAWKRDLESGEKSMAIPKGIQIALASAAAVVAVYVAEAVQNYLQTDPTFSWGELGHTAIIAAIGGLLFWLRSPKDKRVSNEERRAVNRLEQSLMKERDQ